MNDIVKFDTTILKERVAERIRGNFIELIPAEAFDALVNNEIAEFTTIKNRSGYNDNRNYSDLQKMIRDELQQRYREYVKEKFADPEYFRTVYKSELGMSTPEGFIADSTNEFIMKNADALLLNMFKPMIHMMFSNLQQQIRNSL